MFWLIYIAALLVVGSIAGYFGVVAWFYRLAEVVLAATMFISILYTHYFSGFLMFLLTLAAEAVYREQKEKDTVRRLERAAKKWIKKHAKEHGNDPKDYTISIEKEEING